ncbi:carboxylesterase/lipase family protein [Prevotella sp. A2931]|uniref:Carboxylic ester hydrolase n=1 Tax=Prevotella illustrans TaxID=2800387 RepID=A0ABS3M458_9BACT|nr:MULTISPECIES: carboxylesterase/lipase family protein [Prevotella]MBO1362866.1 carboxylesterase/lipase family protein [Prevotella illustrans]PTL25931.1 carboxylesterase [Prevotella sp. oral taxon 820]
MKTKVIIFAALAVLPCLCACNRLAKERRFAADCMNEEVVADSTTVVATVKQGRLAGYRTAGVNIFKGIPYAKARRFMAPEAPDVWTGIRSCRAYGPTCPQAIRTGWQSDEAAFAFNWNDGHAGEDCLRLNIWTRGLGDHKKRPVMVWLHGGGFAAGSGQELPAYDGTNLAREGDVVVVTVNHRLNVLGFLDLSAFGEKYGKSGNAGLLDLVESLRWIKDNIRSFGGDPDNVTIFGQSGGGGKVSTLLAMPAAKGLFHKAIIESGSQLKCMDREYSRRIGIDVVKKLELNASNIGRIAEIPYERLLAAGEEAIKEEKAEALKRGWKGFIFGWGPVVDGDILPQHPFSPAAPAQSKDIPIIIGTTLNEFCASAYVPALRNLPEEAVMKQVRQRYGNLTDDYLKAFGEAYPGYKPNDLLDIDLTFRPMAIEQARLKEAQHGAPVYMYLFTWQSPAMNGIWRATHCMEIPFVFDNTALQAGMTGNGLQARALAKKMSRAWINFAKTGKPTAHDLPAWEPYTGTKGATLLFDNTCAMRYNHDTKLIKIARQCPQKPK